MSLTSHLKDPQSPIAQFMKLRLSNTRPITTRVNSELRSATTLLPSNFGPGYPWALVGMAVDYRLRYYFAATPSQQFVAYQGAYDLAAQLFANPTTFEQLGEARSSHASFYEDVESLDAFFEDLNQFVATIQIAGKRIAATDDEHLARYCIALSLFETFFRSGQIHELLLAPAVCANADELLARVETTWARDVCQIGQRFYEEHASLLTGPYILNPTFVGSVDVGGADADFVVDGCLIDIKTTKNPKIEPSWLYQIVGYLLLDYDDTFAIRSVGIYMARQGKLFKWSADDLLITLANNPTAALATLRAEFCMLCRNLRGRIH